MKHLTCVVRGLPPNTTREDVEDNFKLRISSASPCKVHVVTDETHGNSRAATVTFQDEAKGKKRSCETLKKEFNASKWLGTSSTISVGDDFMGLTPLFGTADATIQYVLFSTFCCICANLTSLCSVYFVHGWGGHAFRTWRSDADDDITKITAWPRDLLPKRFGRENINARIFTLGYNANFIRRAAPNATIQSTAEDLLAHLLADRSNVSDMQRS